MLARETKKLFRWKTHVLKFRAFFSCRKIFSMGDHFVLMVDRLLTESALEAVIGSENQLQQTTNLVNDEGSTMSASDETDKLGIKLVECRICQDEDQDSNMETPCSCSGTLKYAHRRCVQKWCNEKGDIICEICRQQFKPGYAAPSRLFRYGGIPINFGNWDLSRFELHNPHFIVPAATDDDFLDTNFEDYSAHSPHSLICGRTIAILFIILLLLRHTLPIILGGNGDYPFAVFMQLLLRTIGIALPVYIMVKLFISFQRRRRPEDPRFSLAIPDEENELPQAREPWPRSVPVH